MAQNTPKKHQSNPKMGQKCQINPKIGQNTTKKAQNNPQKP
jgi:hypothetical protein